MYLAPSPRPEHTGRILCFTEEFTKGAFSRPHLFRRLEIDLARAPGLCNAIYAMLAFGEDQPGECFQELAQGKRRLEAALQLVLAQVSATGVVY